MPKRKLTLDQVNAIREQHPSLSQKELSEKYGVTRATISRILSNKFWRTGEKAEHNGSAQVESSATSQAVETSNIGLDTGNALAPQEEKLALYDHENLKLHDLEKVEHRSYDF